MPSTFSCTCKNTVNTSIFCDQPAKNAVIYSVFFFAFKNTGICSVLCISGPKSIGIYSIFCVFAWLPQKTVKRKNAVIYSILWLSKTEKSSEKCVKTALFFPILGLPKRIFKFHPLFVHPRPRKTWKPQHPEGFPKRSAAPARPRVAKARISYHQATASPEWANALVPPTPFSGRSGGERSKRPTCAVVQTCKCYRVFEGLGSVNIDCGTMNRMYWYQGFPWLFMECCFHILGMVCLASLA